MTNEPTEPAAVTEPTVDLIAGPPRESSMKPVVEPLIEVLEPGQQDEQVTPPAPPVQEAIVLLEPERGGVNLTDSVLEIITRPTL